LKRLSRNPPPHNLSPRASIDLSARGHKCQRIIELGKRLNGSAAHSAHTTLTIVGFEQAKRTQVAVTRALRHHV
jgi:hypothetical protein